MGTYTPSTGQDLGPRPCWPIDQPLLRLEIEQPIPEPIKFEEDNTTYAIPYEQSLATTDVGTGWIEAGKTYMLLVMVRFELDDANDDLKITVLERTTGSNVVMDGSLRDQHKRFNPPADHHGTYNFVTKFTAGSANTNGPIVFIEHTDGNTEVTQKYAQMVLIDLTNLTEGNDYFYEEDSTDSDNSTTLAKKDEAYLNLTKDNKGAWLLGTAVQYKCHNPDDFKASTIISNQDSSVLSGDLITLDTSSDDDEHILNYTTVLNNDLSDTSWHIAVYTSDETLDTGRPIQQNIVQHTKVWGIRLDRFVSTNFQNHVSISTSDTNNTKVTASELTSVSVKYDSPKFLVIHGGLGKLANTGVERKNIQFYTDVQWKKNGGTYSRFGDDDQQTYSTMVWKGSGDAPGTDFDSEISWWSTVPPETLSDIKSGDTLSFKLEIWKDIPSYASSTKDVDCEDLYLAVIELPPNLNRAADSDANYSLKANHNKHIIGPTTLANCIDVRNKLLESRGFMPPKRWDTVWTKEDITLR